MKEKKIVVNIDEQGGIHAETFGFTGELCLNELEKLLENIAELDEVEKKDEFYKKEVNTSYKNVNIKRG